MTTVLRHAIDTVRRYRRSLHLRTKWLQTAAIAALAGGLVLLAIGATTATRATAVGAQTETSITGLSATCSSDGRTCGVLTVSDPIAGETITLQVTGHSPGSSTFVPLSGTELVVTLVAGQTTYDVCITIPAADLSAGYNTFRLEVTATSDPMTGSTTKSVSYSCTGSTATPTPTPTPSPTPTPTPTPSASPTSTPTPSAAAATATPTPAAGVLGLTTGGGGGSAGVAAPDTGAALPMGAGLILTVGGLVLLALRRRAER